jgi:hypothetical protein
MRGTTANRPVARPSAWPLAVMLWLILLIIFAMWAVPQYVGQIVPNTL